jgi:hypothetical protein
MHLNIADNGIFEAMRPQIADHGFDFREFGHRDLLLMAS